MHRSIYSSVGSKGTGPVDMHWLKRTSIYLNITVRPAVTEPLLTNHYKSPFLCLPGSECVWTQLFSRVVMSFANFSKCVKKLINKTITQTSVCTPDTVVFLIWLKNVLPR